MKKSYLMVMLAVMSCSGPGDKKYDKTKQSLEEDLTTLVQNNVFSDYEAEIIANWIISSELSGKSLDGKTYKQILKEAKLFDEKERKRLEEQKTKEELDELKAKREEQKRLEKANSILSFHLSDKKNSTINRDYIKKDVVNLIGYFQNKSDKDIRAVKGVLNIYDIFGEKISSFNLEVEKHIIKAKDTINFGYDIVYSYDNWFYKLKEKRLEDLKYEFVPGRIIYTDGTEL